MNLASIPSPNTGVWYLGPIPIRGYALAIVAGIFIAVWIAERRLRRRGAPPGTVVDIAVWAVPFGIIGARLYHVATDAQLYFGSGRDPIEAVKIWHGGLGIPGALLAGALGAWLAARRRGIPLSMVADALAPGLPVAQAVGRLGNWFNQELYGRPTDLPWGLEIDLAHRESGYQGFETFHPTFLYEALWNLGGAGLIFWLDNRFRLGRGRAFAIYVIWYGTGRFWVESLRIDEAHSILGLRLNMWTALAAILGGLLYLLLVRGPRQRLEYPEGATRPTVIDDVEPVPQSEAVLDTSAAEPDASEAAPDADAAERDVTAGTGGPPDDTATGGGR
ncbi:MAG TPA: prolipoprotein diacylglyceryl transferase [Micromonosporaceae bacterium]|nr:prolipoprotein diacylglyceryl transferase [Micromonosporaceae bacterium]